MRESVAGKDLAVKLSCRAVVGVFIPVLGSVLLCVSCCPGVVTRAITVGDIEFPVTTCDFVCPRGANFTFALDLPETNRATHAAIQGAVEVMLSNQKVTNAIVRLRSAPEAYVTVQGVRLHLLSVTEPNGSGVWLEHVLNPGALHRVKIAWRRAPSAAASLWLVYDGRPAESEGSFGK
ncbi:MAG: hypothetical protein HQ559_02430 [Lentisphaerae bacterium]|nr:hypothetical protein [Lentisphaerota bacterium]